MYTDLNPERTIELSAAIQIQNLTKRFPVPKRYRDLLFHPFKRDEVTALEDITFHVLKGELFGLLGPNGAGKTTLVKVLCNMILPTSGKGFIFEHDVSKDSKDIKKMIGYVVSEERSFFWRLTGRQNLNFFASLNNMLTHQADARIKEVVSLVGLSDNVDKTFRTYSTGMKQKLAIARGLLTDPEILFLDEPTRALDPIATRKIRSFIKNTIVGEAKKTVVLATNNMHEAEELCDRVTIIDKGHVKICDTIPKIKAKMNGSTKYALLLNMAYEKAQQLLSFQSLKNDSITLLSIQPSECETLVRIEFDRDKANTSDIIKYFMLLGIEMKAFYPEEPSLDELFSKFVD